ncbi:MAG: DNA repair protein RadC [Curvibacter sp.]|nr:DNA repair protein RadC [Curvibacter sp.]
MSCSPYQRPPVVEEALAQLSRKLPGSTVLNSPSVVRDFLLLSMADRAHEVFTVVFLNAQHQVIDVLEMFRGSLTQTSVYPREVLVECLTRQASAVILAHNHPSGHGEPSNADIALTQTLQAALALIEVRVLDHFVLTRAGVLSLAERGFI